MSAVDFSRLEPAHVPRTELQRRPGLVHEVQRAQEVMLRHGAVSDGKVYPVRHLARWRAQRLITLMVTIGLQTRWEVRECTWAVAGGYRWAVEHLGADAPQDGSPGSAT